MKRRDDIRIAMRSLLSPVAQPEAAILGESSALPSGAEKESLPLYGGTLSLSEPPMPLLRELQSTLRENGIQAEPMEIVQAIVAALSDRPTLCRGLLAAY